MKIKKIINTNYTLSIEKVSKLLKTVDKAKKTANDM